jgi:hypothetical protein
MSHAFRDYVFAEPTAKEKPVVDAISPAVREQLIDSVPAKVAEIGKICKALTAS